MSKQCASVVQDLVTEHLQTELQILYRAHKHSLQTCPQHPEQTHTLSQEKGKDCFNKPVKPKNDANGMLFPCPNCTRSVGAGVWTRHLAKCMGIAGRNRTKYPHNLPCQFP